MGTHRLSSIDGGTVKTRKECEPAKGTHVLESAEGGTSQDIKVWGRARDTHSLERTQSGKRKKESEPGHALAVERRGRKS